MIYLFLFFSPKLFVIVNESVKMVDLKQSHPFHNLYYTKVVTLMKLRCAWHRGYWIFVPFYTLCIYLCRQDLNKLKGFNCFTSYSIYTLLYCTECMDIDILTSFIPCVKHPQHMLYKKCHFDTSKSYFIILPHYFTTSHLSDVLSFNFIY